MVKNQLMPNHIKDEQVLNSMIKVPRHLFVEHKLQAVSYSDGRLPLNEMRSMVAPTTLARMIQALILKKEDKVLDIACGTGYSTAVLAEIAKEVIATEPVQELALSAAYNLTSMNYKNVAVKKADLYAGVKESMPFDAILIAGALSHVPENLTDQLKIGGKLVTIIKHASGICKITRYDKCKNSIGILELFDGYAEQL